MVEKRKEKGGGRIVREWGDGKGKREGREAGLLLLIIYFKLLNFTKYEVQGQFKLFTKFLLYCTLP